MPRASLLNGDPFSPEPSVDSFPAANEVLLDAVPVPGRPENARELESAEGLIALSIALPPSSPLRPSSDALPSTPPTFSRIPSSPQSPLSNRASSKPYGSPDISIKRKPVPTAVATPKVTVYDDNKPPDAQPRTPADISRSRRRAKTRSDTAVQQSPIFVGRARISSPPVIPERHPHRNSYPPGSSRQSVSDAPMSSTTRSARHQPTERSGQSSSEQAENDLEGHLHGLEEDRRIWLERREGGTLDVTPPKEGRFERYLS